MVSAEKTVTSEVAGLGSKSSHEVSGRAPVSKLVHQSSALRGVFPYPKFIGRAADQLRPRVAIPLLERSIDFNVSSFD